MQADLLKGTGTALVTPFKNNAIDEPALHKVIEFQINEGVDYLVCLGTTGEGSTLTQMESQQVLDITVNINNGRIPIVFGAFGGNNTEDIISKFGKFNLTGVTALLSVSPYYNKPSQKGILEHYQRLNDFSPLPMIIYNVPGRTSSNILAETTIQIAETCQQIIGIKEASGDLVQASKIIKYKPNNFLVLSGDDPTAIGMLAAGGDGVISVIANAFPGPFSKMVRLGLANNFIEAGKIHVAFIDIHKWLYVEGNPVGIKAAMEIMGLCLKDVRLPLSAMSDENMMHLRNAIQNFSIPALQV